MKNSTTIIKTVWKDGDALATAVANFLVLDINKVVAEKGIYTLALAGGNTPKKLYALLATPPYRNNIPWKKIILAIGDERFVSADNKEHNFKMIRDTLLQQVTVPGKHILSVNTKNTNPEKAATEYEALIKKTLGPKPFFDCILLGLGEDGHTASLFPGDPILNEKKRLVQSTYHSETGIHRISFCLPLINRSKNIVFLVSGENKAAVLKIIKTSRGNKLPAAMVKNAGNLYWFLDEAANGGINQPA